MGKTFDTALSRSQHGIYVECMEDSSRTLYNLPFLGRLGESVDTQRLKAAIEKAAKAHPGLETQLYLGEDGRVMQRRREGQCRVEEIRLTTDKEDLTASAQPKTEDHTKQEEDQNEIHD